LFAKLFIGQTSRRKRHLTLLRICLMFEWECGLGKTNNAHILYFLFLSVKPQHIDLLNAFICTYSKFHNYKKKRINCKVSIERRINLKRTYLKRINQNTDFLSQFLFLEKKNSYIAENTSLLKKKNLKMLREITALESRTAKEVHFKEGNTQLEISHFFFLV